MEKLTYTIKDGVAVITLDDGKANVLGSQTWAELNEALDAAEKEEAIVVITGREGMMSGGFDLKEMRAGQESILALTNKGSVFARRVMAHPRPVIMAATGHTIAMGAFLSMACDYSIIKAGKFKVGLNETLIGMTMHNVGVEMARYHLAKNYFNRCCINAEIFDPKGSVDAGFFDRVVPEEQWPMAIPMVAQMFGQLDPKAFRENKLRSRKEIFKILDQAIEDDLDPEKVNAL